MLCLFGGGARSLIQAHVNQPLHSVPNVKLNLFILEGGGREGGRREGGRKEGGRRERGRRDERIQTLLLMATSLHW